MKNAEGQKMVAEIDKLRAAGSMIEDACKEVGTNKGRYHYWNARLAKANKTQVISYDGATQKASKKQRTPKSQAPIILVMGDPDQVFDFYQKAHGAK